MGTMADHKNAQEVAMEIATSFGVEDVECLLVDQINDDERHRLMTEIDPEYEALVKESKEILERLEASIKNKKDLKDLNRYADIAWSFRSIDAIGGSGGSHEFKKTGDEGSNRGP